jgi:tripartite-type tricarboxylate transporter receptor subunit TctC
MVSGASGHLEAGNVRILAVAEEQRLEGLSDVPTFKEFGYPIVITSHYSFCFPKGTPQKVVDRFFDAQKKAVERYPNEIKSGLRKVEQWADFRSLEDSQKIFRDSDELFARLAKELGASVR